MQAAIDEVKAKANRDRAVPSVGNQNRNIAMQTSGGICLLYTSDAADE